MNAQASPIFFLEKCIKLYGEPWAKRWVHTNFYRIRTMFDHVSKALNVPGLVGISCIWGHSEPHTRGQTTSEVAKNWRPVRFWPKVHCGVWGVFPKKIGLAYWTSSQIILSQNSLFQAHEFNAADGPFGTENILSTCTSLGQPRSGSKAKAAHTNRKESQS